MFIVVVLIITVTAAGTTQVCHKALYPQPVCYWDGCSVLINQERDGSVSGKTGPFTGQGQG